MCAKHISDETAGWWTLVVEDHLTYMPWNPSIRVRVVAPKDLLDVGRCSVAYELTRYEEGRASQLIVNPDVKDFFCEYILPYLVTLPVQERNSISVQRQVARAVIRRILTVGLDGYDGVTLRSKNVQLVSRPQAG